MQNAVAFANNDVVTIAWITLTQQPPRERNPQWRTGPGSCFGLPPCMARSD